MKTLPLLLLSLLLFDFTTSVKAQTACSDTARRNILFINRDTAFVAIKAIPAKNEKRLILGYLADTRNSPSMPQPVIALADRQNNIAWSKCLPINSNPSGFVFRDAVEAPNGAFYIAATAFSRSSFELLLFQFNDQGILLTSGKIDFTVPNKEVTKIHLASTAANDLIVLAIHDENIVSSLPYYWFTLLKYNSAGNVSWSTSFKSPNPYKPSGITAQSGSVYFHAEYWVLTTGPSIPGHYYAQHLMKFSEASGNLLTSKTYFYMPPNPLPPGYGTANGDVKEPSFFSPDKETFISFSSDWSGGTIGNQNISSFDSLLNLRSSMLIQSFASRYVLTHAFVDANAQVVISAINSIDNRQGLLLRLDKDLQVLEQKSISHNSPISSGKGAIPFLQKNRMLLFRNEMEASNQSVEVVDMPFFFNDTLLCTGTNIQEFNSRPSPHVQGTAIFQFQKNNSAIASHINISIAEANVKSSLTCLAIQKKMLDCGPDLSICTGDSITIKANKGFANYEWPITYRQSQQTDSIITVFPLKDTFYISVATTTNGCKLIDTVFVNVKNPANISLGGDTSICSGDSLLLQVNGSFTSYQWNTGSTQTSIFAHQQGQYSVRALNVNGCYSSDTMQLIKVYDTPVFQIQSAHILCINQTDSLDGGNYQSHLWQDGSTSRYKAIRASGLYSVTITDQNGCKATASHQVDSLVRPPSNFLGNDTSICNYQSIQLSTGLNSFEEYLWSTGSNTNNIIVEQPGLYSLQVTDRYQCIGSDSIIIQPKICDNSIFFPTAFTPDGNGINDIYKPIIEGGLTVYQLRIFNRWGQEVFTTDKHFLGWNGFSKNNAQPPGTYTWYCSYQFKNEPVQQRKGTVALLR